MNEILDALRRNLDREIEERRALLGLVEHEGKTIQAGDHEELDRTLGRIRERLAELGPIEGERNELLERVATVLGAMSGPLTLSRIADHVDETERNALLDQRDELRRLLRETMNRNRQNQYLLRFASGMVSETLDLLMANPLPTPRKTYGPAGTTGSSERGGALFRAEV